MVLQDRVFIIPLHPLGTSCVRDSGVDASKCEVSSQRFILQSLGGITRGLNTSSFCHFSRFVTFCGRLNTSSLVGSPFTRLLRVDINILSFPSLFPFSFFLLTHSQQIFSSSFRSFIILQSIRSPLALFISSSILFYHLPAKALSSILMCEVKWSLLTSSFL